MNDRLTVAEVLERAELIERTLAAFEETSPNAVAMMGGRDTLSRCCEMSCIGPIPRLDEATWERMSIEYEDCRANSSINRGGRR